MRLSTIFIIFTLHSPLFTLNCEHLRNSPYTTIQMLTRTTEGNELNVCAGGADSCCTRNMEDQMMANAERQFRAHVEDRIITLRHILGSNLERFRTYFYNSLNTCHHHLDVMFKRTYGPFYEQNSKVFDQFFLKLRAFSTSNSDVEVEGTVNEMFDDLYRVVFSLLNPMSQIGESEWSCMRENMEEMRPFGDVPSKIVAHLKKSLLTWREFVSSIEITHATLDGFMNVSLSRECVSSLTKMSECSLCSTSQPAKPCRSLCLNVAKGCLADWAEADQQWDGVVAAILKLTSRLKGSHNLQNAFNPLPVQISEAIMTFQEKGASVTNRVIANCFPITGFSSPSRVGRSKRAIWLRHVSDQAEGNWRILQQMMDQFSDKLIGLKGFFSSLSSSVCIDSQIASDEGDRCWNGTAVAPYRKVVSGSGFSKQRGNPEFQGQLFLPYSGLFIEERLQFGMLSVKIGTFINGKNYAGYDIDEGSARFPDDDDDDDSNDNDEGSAIEQVDVVNLDPSTDPIDPIEHNIATNALEITSSSTISLSISFALLVLILTRSL